VDAREAWMRDQECECERPKEDVPGVKATWEAAEGVLRCRCEDRHALSSEDARVRVSALCRVRASAGRGDGGGVSTLSPHEDEGLPCTRLLPTTATQKRGTSSSRTGPWADVIPPVVRRGA
jgi:hypothetical protein